MECKHHRRDPDSAAAAAGHARANGASTKDHDDFTQVGNLYRLFDEAHRDRLTTRIADVLRQARPEVQERQLPHFAAAVPDYGRRVATKLGLKTREAPKRKREMATV